MGTQTVTINGNRVVILDESEYYRLCVLAGILPGSPAAMPQGSSPTVTLGTDFANQLAKRRRAVGVSQAELAKRAGVRPETINRIEKGRNTPNTDTIARLNEALAQAEAGS